MKDGIKYAWKEIALFAVAAVLAVTLQASAILAIPLISWAVEQGYVVPGARVAIPHEYLLLALTVIGGVIAPAALIIHARDILERKFKARRREECEEAKVSQ